MEIMIVDTEDTPIVSVRESIAIQNFGALIGKAFDRLMGTGSTCVGSPITVYHSPVVNPDNTDLEVGFPVSPEGKYTRILQGCTCAFTIHRGDYSRLHETHSKIAGWIMSQGYKRSGPPFEVYMNDVRIVQTEELLTEVYFPIEK
jgi:Transcriptional regulator, effector-binding domain/component